MHSLADAAQVGPALKVLTESALPQPLHASLATPGIGLDHQVPALSPDHVARAILFAPGSVGLTCLSASLGWQCCCCHVYRIFVVVMQQQGKGGSSLRHHVLLTKTARHGGTLLSHHCPAAASEHQWASCGMTCSQVCISWAQHATVQLSLARLPHCRVNVHQGHVCTGSWHVKGQEHTVCFCTAGCYSGDSEQCLGSASVC